MAMATINAGMRTLFDILLLPFAALPPLLGLGTVSLVTAVLLLLVFKKTSSQERIALVKRKIHAGLFEIRLFRDDLRAIMRAQGEILWHNLEYLRLSAVPLLWMLAPFVLIVAQLQFHYGYRGLEVGRPTLIKIRLQGSHHDRPAVRLELPDGIRAQGPMIWVPVLQEMASRVVADRPGNFKLRVHVLNETHTKTIQVSREVIRRSPVRPARRFWDQLLYPAEEPLPPGSSLHSISVAYPEATVEVLGWSLHWMIVYFAASILFAFVLRGPLKVQI